MDGFVALWYVVGMFSYIFIYVCLHISKCGEGESITVYSSKYYRMIGVLFPQQRWVFKVLSLVQIN